MTDASDAIENWKLRCLNGDIPKDVTEQKL